MRKVVKDSLHRLAAAIRKIQYYGHSYQCPCCHSHLKMFLPTEMIIGLYEDEGAQRRPPAQCPLPRLWFPGKDRLLYLYLLHKTSTFRKPLKLFM